MDGDLWSGDLENSLRVSHFEKFLNFLLNSLNVELIDWLIDWFWLFTFACTAWPIRRETRMSLVDFQISWKLRLLLGNCSFHFLWSSLLESVSTSVNASFGYSLTYLTFFSPYNCLWQKKQTNLLKVRFHSVTVLDRCLYIGYLGGSLVWLFG